MTETDEGYQIALIFTAPCETIQQADELAIQMMETLQPEFPSVVFDTHGLEALDERKALLDRQNPGDLAYDVHLDAVGLFFAHSAEYVQNRVEGMMVECNFPNANVVVRRRP